jgi:urea ABC transporter ATP-binding protein UrtE
MLRVEDIEAGYGGGAVLQGLSLDVADGEIVAVLGRNGAGKTTMLRAVIGEIPIRAGHVYLGEADVTRRPAHERARRGIGYVPQGRGIFPGLSVLDNLRVAAYGCRNRAWRTDLDELLTQFPIFAQKRQQAAGNLSGGQQQLLALGRSLMTRPRILLLDEPSEGIQPSIVDEIGDAVRTINRERGITIVLVEQNLDFAAGLAPGAYLIDQGRIVRSLPTSDVVADRELQHEYLGV